MAADERPGIGMITAQRRPTEADAALKPGIHAVQATTGPRCANFIYFWPLYTGTAIPIDDWRARMWLDTWV
jgi:hypothetical protein